MASVMRVTGAWTGLLSDWLDLQGLPAPDIRARLARWAPDDVVPVPVWSALLAEAIALRPGMVAPELAIGAQVQPRHVGVLGYLVLASENLGEAMYAYQRYERLFYGVALAEVELLGEQAELRWGRDTAMLGQQGDGVAIAALITFLRRQLDDPPPPSSVSFVHAVSPQVAAAYEAFFECPVVFQASHIAVRFPLSYLQMPMPMRDPGLRELLDRQAGALLAAMPDSSAFDRAVQQVLVRMLAEGEVSLERVAKAVHLSGRTLQRRLAQQGLGWQQLLDRTREQLARQYLADRSLALSDIALLLGFSEQSAFNRAFRRWCGETPARWRRSWVTSR